MGASDCSIVAGNLLFVKLMNNTDELNDNQGVFAETMAVEKKVTEFRFLN